MEFGQQFFFREIDLFDFATFFGLDFLKFSGPLSTDVLFCLHFEFIKKILSKCRSQSDCSVAQPVSLSAESSSVTSVPAPRKHSNNQTGE